MVSLSRNNLEVSERIAALTFSHEVGHSFGAPHDSGGCEGGGEAEPPKKKQRAARPRKADHDRLSDLVRQGNLREARQLLEQMEGGPAGAAGHLGAGDAQQK